jgi:hypothetical protein
VGVQGAGTSENNETKISPVHSSHCLAKTAPPQMHWQEAFSGLEGGAGVESSVVPDAGFSWGQEHV